MDHTPDHNLEQVRWAPCVSQQDVHRLYESEADGLIDEALLDEVGIALLLRCESILQATRASMGEVLCPVCRRDGHEVVIRMGLPLEKADVVTCPRCRWSVAWGPYHATFKRKQLWAGGAQEYFERYVRQYPLARDARERMLAIDRLVHEFHYHAGKATRAAAVNLIEGRLAEVVAFLDALSSGAGRRSLTETSERWRGTIDSIDWHPQ